jgi:hypothetical protein
MFDKPQWPLLPDLKGIRMYANLENRLEIVLTSSSHTVAVALPTGLFQLMKDVLQVLPEDQVTLYIDQVGGKYVFGLLHEPSTFQGSSTLVDLWTYSEKSLPAWILAKEYWIVTTTKHKLR